jgi:hypothetical protein
MAKALTIQDNLLFWYVSDQRLAELSMSALRYAFVMTYFSSISRLQTHLRHHRQQQQPSQQLKLPKLNRL